MKQLNELIIFFLDLCYSLKNTSFMKLDENSQKIFLLDHIKAIKVGINSHLDNLLKELENK